MMGRQAGDQSQLFYLFNLEDRIPPRHLLRWINPIATRVLAELREKLEPFYSEIGRPSIDPELMLRMLIVGYCYGSQRRSEFRVRTAFTNRTTYLGGDRRLRPMAKVSHANAIPGYFPRRPCCALTKCYESCIKAR